MLQILSGQSLARKMPTFQPSQPADRFIASSSSFQLQPGQEPGQHALYLTRGWPKFRADMLLWSLRLHIMVLFVDDRGLHPPWRWLSGSVARASQPWED